MRIKQYQLMPARWFAAGIMEHGSGEEYYFVFIRLPSYQLMPAIEYDANCWHQLVFTFHGKHGFKFRWWRVGIPE